MMSFGEKLSKLRKEYNYTQEQLADILGVSRQAVSKWESDIAYPETDKLIELGRLFDCTMDYLLKEEVDEKNDLGTKAIVGKIMTDKSKAKLKGILKIIGIILAAALAIDVISMLIYFCFIGVPS